MNKILIIIPAYNEEKSIKEVIDDINDKIKDVDIVVINDGSTDNTLNEANKTNAFVIDLPFNLGIGGAMQTGYLHALNNDYDIAVQIDADGQHDASYINDIIKPVIDGQADMVIGSRYLEKTEYKSTFFRRTGMIYFTNLIKCITGKRVTDTTSGFRAVNKTIIKIFANDYPEDYPEVEVIIRLNKKGFKIEEKTVKMHERKAGKSSITPFKSIYYILKVTLGVMISAIKN
jgi:glycosyltransferase involved in cell wall biosynthesis